MNNEFVPTAITEIAKQHGAAIEVLKTPHESDASSDIHFAEIQMTNPQATVGVDLVSNPHHEKGAFTILAVTWEGNEFTDEPDSTLFAVLVNILRGNTREKKTIFGNKRQYVVDDSGNKYWPRR